jgi:hypothetical protein
MPLFSEIFYYFTDPFLPESPLELGFLDGHLELFLWLRLGLFIFSEPTVDPLVLDELSLCSLIESFASSFFTGLFLTLDLEFLDAEEKGDWIACWALVRIELGAKTWLPVPPQPPPLRFSSFECIASFSKRSGEIREQGLFSTLESTVWYFFWTRFRDA